jgi:hypothetical protein
VVTSDVQNTGSRRRRQRDALRQLLAERDFGGLTVWAAETPDALGRLIAFLFDKDPLIIWRAIEALGRTAGYVAERNPEKVRKTLRRLLWLMNDESGGICWYAPEAIAEIIVNVPSLKTEFGVILLSFLYEEPFERGVRWGIYRLVSEGLPDGELKDAIIARTAHLLADLDHPDAGIRHSTLLALKSMGVGIPDEQVKRLSAEGAAITDYDFSTGQMTQTKPADIYRKPDR